jgi:hypothetical protein
MDLGVLLDRLWTDYAAITPQARAIHRLLTAAGETIVNDHIALRTFADPRLGLDVLAAPFVAAGYRPAGIYRFHDKKLDARHYEPPDPALPKLFISELRLHDCSPALQAAVADLLAQVPPDLVPLAEPGRPWSVSHRVVEQLRRESEYAAWLAAHGLRANHFTVLINALTTIPTAEAMVAFLQAHGFALNAAGGAIIKGSPAVLLEQCSTLADTVNVAFTDGVHAVPGCYYEFARRHRDGDGELFHGFIEGSADKIFESTDRKPAT